ncbi:energy-coupling factor transporter ATPase [Aminipila luticellarii]|uniref:ATP-binding cassette domain-containing protein n=1 Tax=Aminipila luticellarii TaxID=2507160 RepID=A0A410PU93_9FIRM|nr:energy-coupling factor transporter ATPase [Aminipila luticellarii]QAT42493.1 ATP-binding cassette domain-containing protein [Aminipila luticellarii]
MESYSIKQLNFSYPESQREILKDIDLTIFQGQFVTLCGASGCGKTTLLRQLKPILSPHGNRTGEIFFEGERLADLDQRAQSAKIGFVLQSPDNQIVTDKVWHELAFGLESLGYDTPTIRLRVAEMASFFGIQTWFYKNVSELSGGQKQLLNLAAIMAMQPSVLILDEPTSQLDPIAASDFLATIGKINRELGTTIIMTEHRLEEVLPLSDRVIVMDEGAVIADGAPKDVGQLLGEKGHKMFSAMPVPMQVYAGVPNDLDCPVTVREGREWLNKLTEQVTLQPLAEKESRENKEEQIVVELDQAWFKYERDLPDVVKGVSLKVKKAEFFALLGGNGTGKSTTLSLISGINKPYRGSVKIEGKALSDISDKEKFGGLLGVLPQNPQALFVKKSVKRDLYEMLSSAKISKDEKESRVNAAAELCQLTPLLEQHPYDLSGGEQQRAALAKVLLLRPHILLLDEPTKGLDAEFKQVFAEILESLKEYGITIIMVSHDVEFCAKYADRCAMFFDGDIVTEGTPREFFSGNSFYTTEANRMARHLVQEVVTAEDIIQICGGKKTISKNERRDQIHSFLNLFDSQGKGFKGSAGTKDKKSLAARTLRFLKEQKEGSEQAVEKRQILCDQVAVNQRKLAKRTKCAAAMMLLLIPLTLFIGIYYLNDRKYYFISMMIILETMLPFAMIFEGRKPQARELIVIACLCAIGVAGRCAFFMLPSFKPIAAITIISGVAFGGEAGFLVGSMIAFASNMFFGQGPWTPWQMFGFGVIGFLAGVLFQKGILRSNRISLAIFGGLATFFIYGGILNPASVLMFYPKPTTEMFILAYMRGVPVDLVHASSTVFFLWIMADSMLEKLDRIKVKYGLIQE